MSTPSHLVLTTIVAHAQWATDRSGILRSARATLQERAQQQRLQLLGEPAEDVEVLPGNTRVRITLSTDAVPARTDQESSPLLTSLQDN